MLFTVHTVNVMVSDLTIDLTVYVACAGSSTTSSDGAGRRMSLLKCIISLFQHNEMASKMAADLIGFLLSEVCWLSCSLLSIWVRSRVHFVLQTA